MIAFAFRLSRNLLALMMVGVLAFIFTPATDRVYEWLSVNVAQPPKANYIVCLGGGSGREARAAVLWHRKTAPYVIVSNRPGAAEWMKTLTMQAGVPANAILVDRSSYTTGDHPHGVAALPGIDIHRDHFVLVTDENHTRRARACFAAAGYEHITCWSGLRGSDPPNTYFGHCKERIMRLPSVIYECAALLQYKFQGKI